MIFFDEGGYPVDQTKDHMDSLVRASILKATTPGQWGDFNFIDYIIQPGLLCRYPKKFPGRNEANCSRDQITMAVMAMDRLGLHADVRKTFLAHLKRFFFSQNSERDLPCSTKLPRPHAFFKDSAPIPKTWKLPIFGAYRAWKKYREKCTGPLAKYEMEFRWFDCADYLLPNQWGMMIVAGRFWQFYWALPLCFLFHLGAIVVSRFSKHHEVNQMVAESAIYRTLGLFRRVNPQWSEVSLRYWKKRNEEEYHFLLEQLVYRTAESSQQVQSAPPGLGQPSSSES